MFPFLLPLLGRPILWYGFLFALGFFLGYCIFTLFVQRDYAQNPALASFRDSAKVHARKLTERVLLAVGLGSIIGARLGDVLFYQDAATWMADPWSILYVWEGGLASHGAAVGIVIGLGLLARRLRMEGHGFFSFLALLDRAVPFVALAGCCIRVGNFINQEILGLASDLPWAVLFLHPADGSPIVPRHPVQLYEGASYLAIFALLYSLWTYRPSFRSVGRSSGLFLLLVFGSRFLIEFVKVEQSAYAALPWLTMGQLLSIPFLILGFWLLRRKAKTLVSAA